MCRVDISIFKDAVCVENQNKELEKCMHIYEGSARKFVCPSPMQSKVNVAGWSTAVKELAQFCFCVNLRSK